MIPFGRSLVAAAVLLVVSGCGHVTGAAVSATSAVGDPAPGDIPRCFDKPLPHPSPAALPAGDLMLAQRPGSGVLGDPPPMPARAQQQLDGALVELTVPDPRDERGLHHDSGFLIRTASGRLAVVTVAHGVMFAHRASITVTDAAGKRTVPTGGCLVYESTSTGLAPLSYSVYPNNDVAVLLLRDPIGTSTLPLAPTGPSRGSWYATTNLGNQTTLTQPARYRMLALGGQRGGQSPDDYFALSGLEPHLSTSRGTDFSTFGASGGVITTIPTAAVPTTAAPTTAAPVAQVVGILIGGWPDHPIHLDVLKDLFGVHINGSTTAAPKVDTLTTTDAITAAVRGATGSPRATT